MKPGLVTLADLPDLAAGKNRTTIVVARLDDRLRDPRYGAFKITQDDVDGWTRNVTETFGGRVAIDYDHSSDRGGGTRAAAWITGLHQDGKLVTADVEFTPRGAKSIRNGDYRYISPTFVANYTDEHGEKHGKALIGAALTNRPVLRKGMPCLSLSRDEFDGVATPKRKKTMNKKTKQKMRARKTTLARQAPRKLLLAAQDEAWRRDPRAYAAAMSPDAIKTLAQCAPDILQKLSPDTVVTLAEFAPSNVPYAGTTNWDAPAEGARRQPLGLDDAGKALHALIADRAASTGKHYFHAMADLTGQPSYREHSDIPPALGQQQGLNPEQAGRYATGRALAVSEGIGWMDAMAYGDHLAELNALQSDDGSASVPWLDSRPISPPRPWSDEDWERDQRRATAAGVVVGAIGPDGQDTQLKELWKAGAEQGRDVVGEMAQEQRQQAIAEHQAFHAGFLDQARAREDTRRSSAINDELIRRARNRVAAPGRPAARGQF